jgi:serine/threonine-protein kinase
MELKHIGRYDIKSLIGQGGMSTVYLGYDPRSQREVAIKILPPYYTHADKFRERFDREALTIALLEHPAIVPVYDMGEEDGQPYIVMRYMSGGSLAEKIKRGPILLRECADMYLRLAPALDTAHARGIIHRDVKPDNLLFDKYDNVFLSDFGLARLRETIGFANISDGSIMGTPAYMSPEQIQGDREIDGRSDIYSMGVVLYQMLSSSVPFNGTTAASVMMMHLINPVPQIHEQNKSLPMAVQAVLDTAMAKNPGDRYQTAGEFSKALYAVTTGVHKKLTVNGTVTATTQQPGKRPTLIYPPKTPAGPNDQQGASAAKPGQVNGNNGSTGVIPSQGKPASQPEELLARKRSIPLWGWVLGVFVIIVLSLSLMQALRGGFPFSLLSAASRNPDNGNSQLTPGSTDSLSPLALGQADKLAFLHDSEIWTSDLDGSSLSQLTSDGVQKSNLQWSPDGQSVLYTADNCLKMVGLLTKQVLSLTCLTGITSINTFDISADGQNLALGLDQSKLYLLPYSQIFHLPPSSPAENLSSLAQCSYYAPYYTGEAIKTVSWSRVDNRLAIILSRLVDGLNKDEVSVLDFNQCSPSPSMVKELLPAYFLFTLRGYYDRPEISGLAWNGEDQLLLNGYVNNAGFGDLSLVSLGQNQSQVVSPNGSCCYRDAHWSPDGTYLFYSYQPEAGGEISLYYTPSSSLNQPTGSMASLAMPAGFFSNSLETLQPALRAVH